MAEWYPDDDELLALSEDPATGVEYIATGQAPYYLQFRRMLHRLLANLAPLGLRVYQTGDLAVRVRPGVYWLGGQLKSFPGSAADVALDNNQNSLIYLNGDNAVGVAAEASGWPTAEHVKLASVTTGGGTFAPGDIADLRGASMLAATPTGWRDAGGTLHLAPVGDGGVVLLEGGDPVGVGGVDLQGRPKGSGAHTSSGDYSFTAGGACIASGNYAVAIGSDCQATAFAAVTLGDHGISSGDSSIALGKGATATAKGSVAVGMDPYAHLIGQFAHSGGAGNLQHVPQFTRTLLNAWTVNAEWNELTSPGRFVLDWRDSDVLPGAAFGVRITAVGRTVTAGQAAMMVRRLLIEKVAGTVALVGAVQTEGTDIKAAALADCDIQLTADDTNKTLKIEVKGLAAASVFWGVTVEACVVPSVEP